MADLHNSFKISYTIYFFMVSQDERRSNGPKFFCSCKISGKPTIRKTRA